MKKSLFLLVVFLILLTAIRSDAWVAVPDNGDVGWYSYVYQSGPAGFTGTAGFVVSNVIDNSAFSELLLDNLSTGGGLTNRGFEAGNYTGYNLLGNSYGEVTDFVSAASGNGYAPTRGDYFSHLYGLGTGVSTAAFQNARGQAGTTGAILETAISVAPGGSFSFDWAFLAGDQSPWDDFALFYMKNGAGTIVYWDGLAQIGSVPVPATLVLMGSGLLGLLGLGWRRGQK